MECSTYWLRLVAPDVRVVTRVVIYHQIDRVNETHVCMRILTTTAPPRVARPLATLVSLLPAIWLRLAGGGVERL